MATQYVQLSGQCYWAQLIQPDEKYGARWTLKLYPDAASWKIYHESGIQKKINEDASGKFIRLDRRAEQLIKGDIVKFSPPTVTYHDKPFTEPVGNGSTVTCTVDVYDTAKGKGSRLRSVEITDLVPYVPQKIDFNEPIDLS